MHTFIDTATMLDSAMPTWSGKSIVGLDTEFMRVHTFWPELALLQIAADGHIALIDPLAFDTGAIGPLLNDPAVTKIIHSASEDLVALAPLCGGRLIELFDTQIAAAFAGLGHSLGYRKLVELLIGVTLPKDETRSDWRRRPLSAQQLAYAEADVVHLAQIHVQLVERIQVRGMLTWCKEDCARLAATASKLDVLPENPHWEFHSAARWPHERQARLKRVLDYRERLARATNRPRQWVFDNETAVTLVCDPPPDAPNIATLLAAQRNFPKSEYGAFSSWLAEPLSAQELDIVPAPPPFEGEQRHRAERLK